MKKVIFSVFALVLMVAFSSCRNTEEKTEDATSAVEETLETPVVEENQAIVQDVNVEVVDSAQTIAKEIQ